MKQGATKVVVAVFILLSFAAIQAMGFGLTKEDLVTATIKGPTSCEKDDQITITATIKVKVGVHVEVTLFENDLIDDDEVEAKTIDRPYDKSTNWEETLKFAFAPKKFEKGKKLEFYVKAGDTKSNKIKVECRESKKNKERK